MRRFLIVSAALAVLAVPAAAQDYSGMIDSSFQNMASFAGTTAVNAAIGESAAYAAGASRAATPTPAGDAHILARLDFTASPAVTRRNNDRMAQALSQGASGMDPAAVRQVLDSGALQAEFARLLGGAGFSPTNLADVLTGYLVISWEVVSGEDSRAHAAGYAVLRDRLRASLASSAAIATMTDADKQQTAETLEVLAMLAAVANNGIRQGGNTAQLPQLRDGVWRTAQTFGVDLRQIAFTDQGFVPR